MSEPAVTGKPIVIRKGAGLLGSLSHRTLAVWYRDAKVWTKFYKASILGNMGEPLLYLLAMGWGLGRMVGTVDGVPYIQFLAPGLVCSTAMYAATFECTFGSFTRMTRQNTYDAILATPVSLEDVVAGEILWGATKGLLSGTAMLLVMSCSGRTDHRARSSGAARHLAQTAAAAVPGRHPCHHDPLHGRGPAAL